MMESEKVDSHKKILKLIYFFSSQNIDFPFLFVGLLELFFFLPLFFSASIFSMLHLFEDLGI
jgi:hypothetical protein